MLKILGVLTCVGRQKKYIATFGMLCVARPWADWGFASFCYAVVWSPIILGVEPREYGID